MVDLRRLGRGLGADDIAEIASLSPSTVEWIFHTFVGGMVEHYYQQFVDLRTGDLRRRPCKSTRF